MGVTTKAQLQKGAIASLMPTARKKLKGRAMPHGHCQEDPGADATTAWAPWPRHEWRLENYRGQNVHERTAMVAISS